MSKQFKLRADQISRLVPRLGSCIASDRITVDGVPVGYMYRETPDSASDSGWRFFAGDEDQAYSSDASHFALYEVNTIANYDRAIIPFLEATPYSAFGRTGSTFQAEPFEPPSD